MRRSGNTWRRRCALAGCGLLLGWLCFSAGCESAPVKKASPAKDGDSARREAPDPKAQETRDDMEALLCAGYDAMYARKFGPAIEYLEKALRKGAEIGEDPPDIHEALVECYQMLGDKHVEKIFEHVKKLTELVPNSFVYHAQMGSFYTSQDRGKEALAEYEKAVACPPPSVGAWRQVRFNQALLYRRMEPPQPEKSIEILEDLSKQNLSAAELYNLNYLMAGCEIDLRRFEKAIPLLEKCIEIDHAGREPRMPFVCWQLGFCYAFAEQPGAAKALQSASRLLLRLPQLHELRFWVAILYRKQKDDKRAAELLQEIIDGKYARPRQAPLLRAYQELAQISIDKRDYKGALATLQRGIAEIPQRDLQQQEARQLLLRLISAYSAIGEDEKVVEELNKVLANDPDFAAASNYLGYLYADKGIKLPEAVRLVERALKAEPESGAYMDSLGWAYYKTASPDGEDLLSRSLEKLHEALKLLKKNAEGQDEDLADDPVVRDHLGDVCFSLGRWDEAKQAWEISLRLCEKLSDRSPDLLPDVSHVKTKLERVKRLLEAEKQAPSNPQPH